MTRKFKWGKNNKCGIINCDKQIDWGEFTSYLACENHHNRKWGLCEACKNKKTTHAVYYDIYHGDDNAEQAFKEIKEGIKFQKEIIQEFFLVKNISGSLKQKLNTAYEKALEAEKIIPELERLTQEYWEKKLNCASNFIQEKGGQQTNIYESNLCDDCGDEVNNHQQELKNDYQLNVLDKLIAFSPETNAQIEKEIGRDETQKIAFDLALSDKSKEAKKLQIRYHFQRKLPFFKSKSNAEQKQKKKANFQKLKQYFTDNQILQIVESGGNNYIIWHSDGNVEEKSSSQLSEWGKLRSYFFHYSVRGLSLHEINNVLKSLDQVPSPSKEEEKQLNRNKEEGKEVANLGVINGKEKPLLADLEKELIRKFFQKNKIKKISLKNGELIITHNNNNNNNNNEIITNSRLTDNLEYQVVKDSLKKANKSELTSQELGINSENISANTDNSPSGNKYLWLGGGIVAGVIISVLLVFLLRRKKQKNN